MSLKAPWYELSQFNGLCAFIFVGRQLVIKKLPKNSEYFIDKHLGMFEINHSKSFFLNKCEILIYDSRNQNAFDPYIANELYKWANNQGLYKITRADIKHAIRLRELEAQQKEDPNKELIDQLVEEKRQTRKFMNDVQKQIEKKNESTKQQMELDQGEKDSDEYHIINDEETNYLIVQNLYEHGFIDKNQQRILNSKVKRHEVRTPDDLVSLIDSYSDKNVTKPISHEMERFLDEYHTYNPRNIIRYIKQFAKIRNGISKLRTKAVINWFPSMYILFGCLGVGIIFILWSQYGSSVDPSALIPGT